MDREARDSGDDAPRNLGMLLRNAHAGSSKALGELLELCRPYLLLIANKEMRAELQGKVSPSDLVQDSFLEAQRDFDSFRGSRQAELLRWLRRILLHNVANENRKFFTGMRRLNRELAADPGHQISGTVKYDFVSDQQSPRSLAARREEAERIRRALTKLPEVSQVVIHLRHEENLSFAQIGQRLSRSAEAARKLWFRAIERLREELGQPHAERRGQGP